MQQRKPIQNKISTIPIAAISLFLLLSLGSGYAGKWKILGISWIAFSAMAIVIPFGAKAAEKRNLPHVIGGYGLTSGAMITSAAIFLAPVAIHHHAVYGGVGIALGMISGFAIHTLNHEIFHDSISIDTVILELTIHGLIAGLVIGTIYASMPALGLLLGIAIVSHKAPAGYAAARRLVMHGKNPYMLLLPASAIGIMALPASLLDIPEYAEFIVNSSNALN